MNDIGPFLGIALGVLVAITYPILKGYVKETFGPTQGVLPPWVKDYGLLMLFCLMTAFIALALYRSSNPDAEISFWVAVVMGFGWEASVEKAFAPPLGGGGGAT